MLIEQGDSREAVAARLVRAREITGMDKQTYAATLNLSPQAYGAFENGTRELTLATARLLRKTYGLTFEFLYFGNMSDLPHRVVVALNESPSVKSAQKSSDSPD